MKYRILGREPLHQGFLRVDACRLEHELFAGGSSGEVRRELVERGHAVVVMPYDPQLDAVVMVEQFRIGATVLLEGPWLLEFVAGMIEPGEDVQQVARREALEEAGLSLGELLQVAEYLPSAGACSEIVTILCGRVDASAAGGIHGLPDEHEDIRVQVLPFAQAFALVRQRRLRSAAPIIALEWLRRERSRLRRRWRCGGGVATV